MHSLLFFLIDFFWGCCSRSVSVVIFLLWNLRVGCSDPLNTNQSNWVSQPLHWGGVPFTREQILLSMTQTAWKQRMQIWLCFCIIVTSGMWHSLFLSFWRRHTLFTVWLIFNLKTRSGVKMLTTRTRQELHVPISNPLNLQQHMIRQNYLMFDFRWQWSLKRQFPHEWFLHSLYLLCTSQSMFSRRGPAKLLGLCVMWSIWKWCLPCITNS